MKVDLNTMPIKFFPKDVIGKKPKKVGDVFRAQFMGGEGKFKVSEFYGDMFFATIECDEKR
ncbi:hypothetical protein HFN89_00125 [Rhizobium laguerreae]|nr:hypothetical protein [Rhizobium laguerreae]